MKNIIISIFIVLFVIACTADGAWDFLHSQADIFQALGNYDNRIKVTFDNSSQDENLTNFPVLVILNTSRVTYGNISADGSGIKFISSDFSTELSYEVEEWNFGGDSFFWVKIPSITALSNSDYFWIYYSTDSNSDSTNSNSVWDNGYLAVWHMNDSGSPLIEDSSSSRLDGTANLGFFGADRAIGKIAGAQIFTGNPDSILISQADILDNLGPVTFSFWMLDEGYSDHNVILEKGGVLTELRDPLRLRFSAEYKIGTDRVRSRFNDIWTPGIWKSFYITWQGSPDHNSIQIFADSNLLTNPDSWSDGEEPRDTDAGFDLTIGSDSTPANSFTGQLDEIRISNIVRSLAWMSAQYLSMTDTFLTYGQEENVSN